MKENRKQAGDVDEEDEYYYSSYGEDGGRWRQRSREGQRWH